MKPHSIVAHSRIDVATAELTDAKPKTFVCRPISQEDGNGNEIWRINSTGGDLSPLARAFSEPSGIIDVSLEVGYQPGSVLLTSIQGTGSRNGQLGVLLVPEPPGAWWISLCILP